VNRSVSDLSVTVVKSLLHSKPLDTRDQGRYLEPMTQPYRVFVVVDRDFGQHLTALAEMGPVWIADTPVNKCVAQKIWAAYPRSGHLEGVTTFNVPDGTSSEDILINELGTIDLHHGTYSANPPYTVLEVIGTSITARLKAELGEYGFDHFQETARGFRATRPIPDQPTL